MIHSSFYEKLVPAFANQNLYFEACIGLEQEVHVNRDKVVEKIRYWN